jgi:hypothetical protein
VKKGSKKGDGVKSASPISAQQKEAGNEGVIPVRVEPATSQPVGGEEAQTVDSGQDIDLNLSFLDTDNGNDQDIELPLITSSPRSTPTSNTQLRPYNNTNPSTK